MLFAQKRFFERLLRLMEPIGELKMLFPIVLERHLQRLAIPIQLQAFEKLWTNLYEGMTKGNRKRLAHVGFATLELILQGAIKHLHTETHQALEQTFTVDFKIRMKLRERVPILDGDVIITNSFGQLFYARRQTLYTTFLNPEATDEDCP